MPKGILPSASEGEPSAVRSITSKDIIMEMADLGAVGTGPPQFQKQPMRIMSGLN